MRRLRVLTLNLLAVHHADGDRRQDVVRAGLAQMRPDVLAFQEVTRTAERDQVEELLGPGLHVVDHPRPSADGVGACLVSRWPLGTPTVLDLRDVTPRAAGLPWAAAVAVQVQVPPPIGPVLVVHHKPSWEFGLELERELQAVATASMVEDLVAGRDLPVVVLGDFDAAPDAASTRFWTGRQSLAGTSVCYVDAWEAVHPADPGPTFSRRNPLVRAGETQFPLERRIDHVLLRSGPHGPPLAVADCAHAFAEPVDGVWASDHLGVLATFGLPDHPPGTWA